MILTTILLFIVGVILIQLMSRKEHFEHCGDCGKKSRDVCKNCIDCVYCETPNNEFECIPGDMKGPSFRTDCKSWEYAPKNYGYNTFYNKILAYPPYLYDMRNPSNNVRMLPIDIYKK